MKSILDYVDFLKGKKTYILGILALIYGISGYCIGQLGVNDALQFIWGGFTAMAMRVGISKVDN